MKRALVLRGRKRVVAECGGRVGTGGGARGKEWGSTPGAFPQWLLPAKPSENTETKATTTWVKMRKPAFHHSGAEIISCAPSD